jgi:hypothetical protein
VTVYLPIHELQTLIVSGNASVTCDAVIHAAVFSVLHKGTSSIKLKSDAAVIQTMTTRSGRISVEGAYSTVVSRKDSENHLIVAYMK